MSYSLSVGAVVGIAIGAGFGFLIIVLLLCIFLYPICRKNCAPSGMDEHICWNPPAMYAMGAICGICGCLALGLGLGLGLGLHLTN